MPSWCKKVMYNSKEAAAIQFKKVHFKEGYPYYCSNCLHWHVSSSKPNCLHKKFLKIIRRGDAQFIKMRSGYISDWRIEYKSELYNVRYYEKTGRVRIKK